VGPIPETARASRLCCCGWGARNWPRHESAAGPISQAPRSALLAEGVNAIVPVIAQAPAASASADGAGAMEMASARPAITATERLMPAPRFEGVQSRQPRSGGAVRPQPEDLRAAVAGAGAVA